MEKATFDQYLRLGAMIKDGSLDRKTVQAIIEKRIEIYRIHVSYAKLPGESNSSYLFDGRVWERHSSCVKIDETPGERDFRIAEIPAEFLGKRIEDIWNSPANHFDHEGYRFAIEIEAIKFADAKPELQHKNWILALGSSTLYDGDDRSVTMLNACGRDPVLRGYWTDSALSDRVSLLLVRK